MSRKSTLLREAGLALLVCAAPALFVLRGVSAPQRLTLKLGPNDGDYTEGFLSDYEITARQVTRWSTHDGVLKLPFVARGADLLVEYRAARMLSETAAVDVLLGRRLIDRFHSRGGAWLERRVELAHYSGPLDLEFLVDSHDTRGMGLRMDWVRITARAGRLRPTGMAGFGPLLLCLGCFLLMRAGGLGPRVSAAAAAVPGIAALFWAGAHPFAVAHFGAKLWASALVVTGVATLVARRLPSGRWLVPIVLLGHLSKGVLVFNPGYFYLDVQNHGRYVRELAKAEGSLVARGRIAQVEVGTAYPRFVAGKAYVFPYSPLYFVPFLPWAVDSGPVENALRHAGLCTAALEPIVVFALGAALGGPATGVAAALAAALAPVFASRLLYAMWPTLAGHVLDVLAILAALLYLRRRRGWQLAALAAACLAALMTYVTSLITVSVFLVCLMLLARRDWKVLLGVMVGSVSLTVLLLYAGFTRLFLTEIVPALLSGAQAGSEAARAAREHGSALATLGRIPFFYGWLFPAVAAIGGVLLYRRTDGAGRRVLSAYALALGGLICLRIVLPGLFGDLKEMTFAAPLFAIGMGASLDALARRPRWGGPAAVALALLLGGFWVGRARLFFDSYRAPYVQVEGPGENG